MFEKNMRIAYLLDFYEDHVLRALAHIACEHNLDAHLLHIGSDARLAIATLWGVEA